jgi:hypothetical protein
VLDLLHHPHFKDSHHVANEPYFRYYCGVPITTENDVNIGCLFMLDTETKPAMRRTQLKILTTCARNIMSHFQTVKDAHDKKRAMRMNMTMADFINPRRARQQQPSKRNFWELNSAEDSTSHLVPETGGSKVADHELDPDTDDDEESRDAKQMQANAVPLEQINPSQRMVTEADHQKAFDRAVHLLRQSLDLQMGGGVVFLEATIFGGDAPWQKTNATYTEESRNTVPFLKRSDSDDSDKAISHISTKPPSRTNSQYSIRERVILAAASMVDSDGVATPYGRADST